MGKLAESVFQPTATGLNPFQGSVTGKYKGRSLRSERRAQIPTEAIMQLQIYKVYFVYKT